MPPISVVKNSPSQTHSSRAISTEMRAFEQPSALSTSLMASLQCFLDELGKCFSMSYAMKKVFSLRWSGVVTCSILCTAAAVLRT